MSTPRPAPPPLALLPPRYERYKEGPPRLGWMFNMLPTSLPDPSGNERSGLDMYFLEQDGGTFKATVSLPHGQHLPYYFVYYRVKFRDTTLLRFDA